MANVEDASKRRTAPGRRRRTASNSQNWSTAAGYDETRIRIDPSVVRGLEYYTGPVFEVELTFPVEGEDGKPVRFGSVAGGGRYDGLVGRFRSENIPATGISIGVSRLMAALQHLKKVDTQAEAGPVVVTVFDQDRIADYQKMVAALRSAGIRAELYLGAGKFGAQMKYADKRGSALRRHPGRRREGQGRSADQGPDPRRDDLARSRTATNTRRSRPRRSSRCRRISWSTACATCWRGTA